MNDEEITVSQYIKKREINRLITSIIIKCILSAAAAVAIAQTKLSGIEAVLVGAILFTFIYDLCSLFQFSLRLTGNYIIAIFLTIAILAGIFYLGYLIFNCFGWFDKQYPLSIQYLFSLIVILLMAIPLIYNIYTAVQMKRLC